MGKGGNKTEWQLSVDSAYQEWKYNDLHKSIKSHFIEANTRKNVPQTLKQNIQENSSVVSDLNCLQDIVKNTKEETKKVFVRDSSAKITFLGANIEVPADVADDEEVITVRLF